MTPDEGAATATPAPPPSAPLFSVIVPTHDRPDLLPVAVASVLAQSVDDFEVLIVDDAGTRPPAPFDDPRVRIIRRERNGGPAAAINTGAAAARGRYLAFLADDDLWVPQRLDFALQGLARAPVAVCWSRYIDEVPSSKPVLDGDVGDSILDTVTPSMIATALDRGAFIPIDERYRGTEDVAWWLTMAQRHEVATVPRVGALVRRHAEVRVSHGDGARIEGGLRLIEEHQEWFDAHPRARAMRWQRIGLTSARAGSTAFARRAYLASLRARPRLRPLLHLARTYRPGPSAPPPSASPATRALRILQVITDDDRRGAQVFAQDLGAACRDRGHHVTTVALAPGAAGGLAVETLGPTRLGRQSISALRRRLSTSDIVVAHGSSTLPACALATAGTGVPFVYRQISDSLFWAGTPARRWRVRALLRRAAAVVALAPGAADVLRTRFAVPEDAIAVIPNGVPAGSFAPSDQAAKAAARESFGLAPERPVVLSIAALVPEKGVDLVIDAVATLPDVQLLVAGDGPARADLERAARRLVPDRCVFAGSLADPAPAYAAADLVVLASRGGDSMPAALVEAGFCGLPVVSTDVGAIADVVIDGRTGVVLPVAEARAVSDAIAEVLTSPDRAAAWGEAARRHCLEHFEIGVVADRWLQVLDAVAPPR
jgi:glycosyltransferase involved in cell wall biosynthesis